MPAVTLDHEAMDRVALEATPDQSLLQVVCRSAASGRLFRGTFTGSDAAHVLNTLGGKLTSPLVNGTTVDVIVDRTLFKVLRDQ